MGLLFGNVYYGYMAGRLAHKEGRTDVTAQPYGINTTGAFITLGAINLTALFNQLYADKNVDKMFAGSTLSSLSSGGCLSGRLLSHISFAD